MGYAENVFDILLIAMIVPSKLTVLEEMQTLLFLLSNFKIKDHKLFYVYPIKTTTWQFSQYYYFSFISQIGREKTKIMTLVYSYFHRNLPGFIFLQNLYQCKLIPDGIYCINKTWHNWLWLTYRIIWFLRNVISDGSLNI